MYDAVVQVDVARHRLRSLILDGTYQPGARLTEVQAAAALSMSRTPVREALRALIVDGLVRPTGRGVEVTALDLDALHDAYAVRGALEALTAQLAAARQREGRVAPAELESLLETNAAAAEATAAGRLEEAVDHNRRFHRQIAVLAANGLALEMLDRIWDQIIVSTRATLVAGSRRIRVTDQHDRLLAAIREGDSRAAGAIARRHALDTRASAIKEP